MTDYTDIALSALLPGEPWTSGKALAIYENPTAIAEGAVGAPRISGLALIIPSRVAADVPVLTVTASTAFILGVGAPSLALSGRSGLFERISQTTLNNFTGTVRARAITTGNASLARFLKNAVVVDTFSTPGTRTFDISVVPGDIIELQYEINGGGATLAILASDNYQRTGAIFRGLQDV